MFFDQKKQGSTNSKDLKDTPMPPLPFAKQVIQKEEETRRGKDVKRLAHKEGNLTIGEALILIKDMEEKGEKMKEKLDEMFRQKGMTPELFEAYMSNPNNFTPQQWNKIIQKRHELIDSLNLPPEMQALGEKFAPRQSGQMSSRSTPSAAQSSANPKERRKAGGAQRRGWLPMR